MAEPRKPHLTQRTFAPYYGYTASLREGGAGDALATYWSACGRPLYAFCPEGLLIDPEGQARFVRYEAIIDTGYYDGDLLAHDKGVIRRGGSLESFSIQLSDGEKITLILNPGSKRSSERLTVAGLLERIVRKTLLEV